MRRINIRKEIFTSAVALMALILVCSQFFYAQAATKSKKDVNTEQQEDQSEEDLYFSQPSSSLPSPSHVELSQTLIFLFEIVFEKDESEKRDLIISLPPNLFFKTRFDGVISPNAP